MEVLCNSIANRWKRKTMSNQECSTERHKRVAEILSILSKSWKKRIEKIFARVNNLYRTKRGYHEKEQMEQDAASLSMYSHENQEEG